MVLYLVPVGRQSIHGSMYRVRTLCVYDDVVYGTILRYVECTGVLMMRDRPIHRLCISTVLVVFFKNLVSSFVPTKGGGEEVRQVNMFLKDHHIQPIRCQEMMIF